MEALNIEIICAKFAVPATDAASQVKRKRGRPPLRQLTPTEKAQRAMELV